MTQTQITMTTLYDRLSGIGFPKKFVREKALPDWWDEKFEATPGAVVTAALYVSRRLNLDIDSLLQPEAAPAFKQSCKVKFKIQLKPPTQQLKVAQAMAARVAEMVAYTCVPEYKPLSIPALDVRNEILKTHELVSLTSLLEFCCNYGIPVVHFDKFTSSKGVHKFDGMVGFFYKRPVIVISLNQCSPAKLLFILAHELGHILKGHIQGAYIVDENIDSEPGDIEEIEANKFAVEVLLGKPDMKYYMPPFISGDNLASCAREISGTDNVDPGVVVLNYSWHKARLAPKEDRKIIWATAYKALKIIEGDADAPKQINRYLQKYVDKDRLDGDSQDYLELALAG